MSPDNTTKLATPRCTKPIQAFSGLFRTPVRLRTPTTVSRPKKRARGRTSSLSPYTPSTPNTTSLPAVILQTYSVSTDSIVLTALPSMPFCCHEDLLTMSRAQLEGVVRTLNAQLPRRMRICPEDDFWNDDQDGTGEDGYEDGLSRMSEAEMKRRIEELVGIRAVVGKSRVSRSGLGLATRSGVPPAPKAVRTRDATWKPAETNPWEMEVDAAEDHSDDLSEDATIGSSPLAGRTTRVRGQSNTLSRLAILQEENEGAESKEDEIRPSKKQRVSFGGVTLDSEGPQVGQDVKVSRLIENMDLSGSPLLASNDDAFSQDFADHEKREVPSTINQDYRTRAPEAGVRACLERRRSARIKDTALKRTSSVSTRKTTTLNGYNSSLFRSKTSSSRRFPRNISTSLEESDTRKGSGAPREFTIRLPFTSTPPDEKPNSAAWSAPRILRSHSQRLLNAAADQSKKKKSSLGRSQSERYPRSADLAFVTINRPRYRFTQRKSKGAKVEKENQASQPSVSTQHSTRQLQDIAIHTEQLVEHEKENEDPKVATRNSAMANIQLQTLPSALCSLLTLRSRAPSTSTVASTRDNSGNSPARSMVKEGMIPTAITDSAVGDRVTEALGGMVVDSL